MPAEALAASRTTFRRGCGAAALRRHHDLQRAAPQRRPAGGRRGGPGRRRPRPSRACSSRRDSASGPSRSPAAPTRRRWRATRRAPLHRHPTGEDVAAELQAARRRARRPGDRDQRRGDDAPRSTGSASAAGSSWWARRPSRSRSRRSQLIGGKPQRRRTRLGRRRWTREDTLRLQRPRRGASDDRDDAARARRGGLRADDRRGRALPHGADDGPLSRGGRGRLQPLWLAITTPATPWARAPTARCGWRSPRPRRPGAGAYSPLWLAITTPRPRPPRERGQRRVAERRLPRAVGGLERQRGERAADQAADVAADRDPRERSERTRLMRISPPMPDWNGSIPRARISKNAAPISPKTAPEAPTVTRSGSSDSAPNEPASSDRSRRRRSARARSRARASARGSTAGTC